jgi:hypothetical protein
MGMQTIDKRVVLNVDRRQRKMGGEVAKGRWARKE